MNKTVDKTVDYIAIESLPLLTVVKGQGSCFKWVHFVRHAESNWNGPTQGEHVGAHPGLVDVD